MGRKRKGKEGSGQPAAPAPPPPPRPPRSSPIAETEVEAEEPHQQQKQQEKRETEQQQKQQDQDERQEDYRVELHPIRLRASLRCQSYPGHEAQETWLALHVEARPPSPPASNDRERRYRPGLDLVIILDGGPGRRMDPCVAALRHLVEHHLDERHRLCVIFFEGGVSQNRGLVRLGPEGKKRAAETLAASATCGSYRDLLWPVMEGISVLQEATPGDVALDSIPCLLLLSAGQHDTTRPTRFTFPFLTIAEALQQPRTEQIRISTIGYGREHDADLLSWLPGLGKEGGGSYFLAAERGEDAAVALTECVDGWLTLVAAGLRLTVHTERQWYHAKEANVGAGKKEEEEEGEDAPQLKPGRAKAPATEQPPPAGQEGCGSKQSSVANPEQQETEAAEGEQPSMQRQEQQHDHISQFRPWPYARFLDVRGVSKRGVAVRTRGMLRLELGDLALGNARDVMLKLRLPGCLPHSLRGADVKEGLKPELLVRVVMRYHDMTRGGMLREQRIEVVTHRSCDEQDARQQRVEAPAMWVQRARLLRLVRALEGTKQLAEEEGVVAARQHLEAKRRIFQAKHLELQTWLERGWQRNDDDDDDDDDNEEEEEWQRALAWHSRVLADVGLCLDALRDQATYVDGGGRCVLAAVWHAYVHQQAGGLVVARKGSLYGGGGDRAGVLRRQVLRAVAANEEERLAATYVALPTIIWAEEKELEGTEEAMWENTVHEEGV